MKNPSLDARNLVFFIILLMHAIHIQTFQCQAKGAKAFNRKFGYFAGVIVAIWIALSASCLTFTSNLQPFNSHLSTRYYSNSKLCLNLQFLFRLFTTSPSSEYNIISKGFVMNRLILPFKMIFGRYQHIVKKYCVPCLQMTRDDIGN